MIKLPVDYYYQFDSATQHGARMCYSSANAMLLKHLDPEKLTDSPNADDEYLKRVLQYGDTTDASAQVKALRSYGLDVQFRQDLKEADIEAQLKRGIPVPIGVLHHGHVSAPGGGGHWICVVGMDGPDWIVHDPAGEMDLVNGRYPSGRSGKFVRYSRKNLGPRWRVGGGGGWGIIAEPPTQPDTRQDWKVYLGPQTGSTLLDTVQIDANGRATMTAQVLAALTGHKLIVNDNARAIRFEPQ